MTINVRCPAASWNYGFASWNYDFVGRNEFAFNSLMGSITDFDAPFPCRIKTDARNIGKDIEAGLVIRAPVAR